MGMVRSFAVIAVLAIPAAGLALTAAPEDPLTVFAGCAGRYSAEMEHRWLMGRDAGAMMRRRQDMVDMVDAILPALRGPEVLGRRLEAKFAQARLLQQGDFSADPMHAARARNRARAELAGCEALLPG